MKQRIIFISVLSVLVCAAGLGQDLGTQLSKVTGANAEAYVGGILSDLGADFNSGFYHSADLHSILGFDVGLKFAGVSVKDEDKVFDFQLPSSITYSGVTLNAPADYDAVVSGSPTALGAKDGIPVKVKQTSPNVALRGATIFTTPGGFDISRVPLIVPQASIGLPFGLEVIGRFIPSVSVGDAGKVNFIGFGLRHDIDQYIPLLPIDIAVHFMIQKLTFNDKNDKKIMSASASAFGVEVSKSLVLLTLYGGFQIEKASWDFESYQYTPPSGPALQINGFSVDSNNKSRFLLGARLLLAIINVHVDYSFAKTSVLTAGVGLSFR